MVVKCPILTATACVLLNIKSMDTCLGLRIYSTSTLAKRGKINEFLLQTRRDTLKIVGTTASALLIPVDRANAARGAAELDLEYYIRDLIGGNPKQGAVQASKPPPLPLPRTLEGPLLQLLLNKDCSADCIPVQALIQQVKESGNSEGSVDKIAQDIRNSVDTIREKTSRSFYVKAPWLKDDVTDQYYFDVTAYALWKTAAALLPNNLDRDKFVRNVGKLLVARLTQDKVLRTPNNSGESSLTLAECMPIINQVLQLFQSCGYCKEYRIRTNEDGPPDPNRSEPVFDELDDESLDLGGNVNCLVSIIEPASLSASLQINAEQSRFGPDLVGTTLAAVWEKYASITSSWENFFVDAEYRPNPKDYFPNELLLQFTLTRKN